MPTALSADAFADLVQRSRLLSADQLQEAMQELDEEGTDVGSPEALAEALIGRGLLTRWQVGYLLKGKHNGFYLGSYRFLEMLGKGGMGAVYLAEHEMMRRRCAIKVLPTKLISENSSVLERFYLEAQAVAALDDPNIVRAYDVNKEVQGKREIHYLVMEYVKGSDLQVKVEKEGPLDYVQIADFASQAASGLAHAHENGLIHRDIKPANLLIDDKGTVKILDLGLARFFDDRLEASLTTTHNESILGTADYLSPEQALDSHNVDTRTDIYSLGCTCYFMLTGQPPFPEGSVAQRLMSHQVKSPTAIEKLRPDVPVDLVTIVEQMLAKNSDDRYQTAGEVADAFVGWLAKHADDNWKEAHQEIVRDAPSKARREPTRAKSAATEDTDLELGFAPLDDGPAETKSPSATTPPAKSRAAASGPTKPQPTPKPIPNSEPELGLDQLEELQPATALDASSSSGGLDDLLTEALDNYPALETNVNLAVPSPQSPLGSGIQPAAKPAIQAEPNQLVKLMLIGFAVSIPLAIVILLVSFLFSSPDRTLVDAGSPTGQVRPPDTAAEDAPPPAVADPEPDPATPFASEATNHTEPPTPAVRQERQPAAEPATPAAEPATPAAEPATPAAEPATPSTEPPPQPADTGQRPATPAPTTPSPPETTSPAKGDPPQAPAASDTDDGQADPKKPAPKPPASEPQPPSPEQIKRILGGLSNVTIKLDHEPKNNYELMVLRTAQEALGRAGLKTDIEAKDGASSAVLTLSFEPKNVAPFVVFYVGAELKCRDEASQEVSLWKHREEVAKLKPALLGKTPPLVLRKKVLDFYAPLVKEYRQAKR